MKRVKLIAIALLASISVFSGVNTMIKYLGMPQNVFNSWFNQVDERITPPTEDGE